MVLSTVPDARKPAVALFKALKLDNTTELQNLLSDVELTQNIPENDFRDLLGKAVGNGNEEAVRLLLRAGARTLAAGRSIAPSKIRKQNQARNRRFTSRLQV